MVNLFLISIKLSNKNIIIIIIHIYCSLLYSGGISVPWDRTTPWWALNSLRILSILLCLFHSLVNVFIKQVQITNRNSHHSFCNSLIWYTWDVSTYILNGVWKCRYSNVAFPTSFAAAVVTSWLFLTNISLLISRLLLLGNRYQKFRIVKQRHSYAS